MFRREEATLLRDQLLKQFDRAFAIDLPEFAVAFTGFNYGPKPRKARLRQEIYAATLQKRDNRKIQCLVHPKLANRPLDDRQELVEMRPPWIPAGPRSGKPVAAQLWTGPLRRHIWNGDATMVKAVGSDRTP